MNTLSRDTICAVSTPPGRGGLAVVRVSGPDAISCVMRRWHGCDLSKVDSHTVHLGHVYDSDGSPLDQVVITVFRAPHSYTGEDVLELSCHGSTWIQQQLVDTLIDSGCRLAEPGEFTRRAFANGRLDLTQAEAVADVIAATSRSSLRLALHQMRGGISRRLATLRQQLVDFVALIELELDFGEEDVTFADRSQLVALASHVKAETDRLASSFAVGDAIKNGLPVTIVGATNAGKSTLLNALLGDDRAIVSDIHGTTRDVIEDTITVDGRLMRFIDTAGIRHSDDAIETMGIERSWRKVDEARLVLWVVDVTAPVDEATTLAHELLPRCEGKQLLVVYNKTDIAVADPHRAALASLLPDDCIQVAISAHHEADIELLRHSIAQATSLPDFNDDTVVITNARHYEALVRASEALTRVLDGLNDGLSGELVSQDIAIVTHHLGSITGQVTNHEILGAIFSRFCIGK